MGRLADIYSRKVMIIAGLVLWSLMTFISGFANSLSFLIITRLLVGVGESALSPAVYSLLSDYFRADQRGTVFSIYAAGIFVGIGGSFLVGGGIAEAYNWRISMKMVGLPGLLIAALGWFVIKEMPRDITQNRTRYNVGFGFSGVLRYILQKKTILLHFAGFSFLALTGYTVLGFIGTVLKEVHGTPELIPKYGWFMAATGLSVMASGKAADWLAQRWNGSYRFVMAITAGLACLPLYYFGLFADSGFEALIFIGLANIISSSYNGISAAILQYLVKPNMRAMASGLYLFVISVVGFGIGPPLTGWLMDNVFPGQYGPAKALMLVIACCGLFSTICFMLAMKTYEEDKEED